MKKILVTGAGGLVGYDVAKALMNDQRYEVFVTVHTQKIDNWKNVIQIDLQNTDIETIKMDFDCIVHCAAMIPDSMHSDEQVAYANRRIDDNIIAYCSKYECRLIYISGVAVYGYGNNELLTEQTKINANSYYVDEKRKSEIRIESSCSSYCILRVSSPYGQRQKNIAVIKKFVDAVHVGENIYYFGTGERTQNFIDVRDVAQAVLKCIEFERNAIFNIANKNSISMKNLANLVLKLGKNIFNTESKVYAGNNIDSQENVRINVDISLAEKVLGWKPQIALEDGISDWMKSMKGELG